jgi:hypothetical protein
VLRFPPDIVADNLRVPRDEWMTAALSDRAAQDRIEQEGHLGGIASLRWLDDGPTRAMAFQPKDLAPLLARLATICGKPIIQSP